MAKCSHPIPQLWRGKPRGCDKQQSVQSAIVQPTTSWSAGALTKQQILWCVSLTLRKNTFVELQPRQRTCSRAGSVHVRGVHVLAIRVQQSSGQALDVVQAELSERALVVLGEKHDSYKHKIHKEGWCRSNHTNDLCNYRELTISNMLIKYK